MSRDPFGMTVVWDTPRRASREEAEKIVRATRMLLSGKSADELALEPAVAPLRCWEHEDCLEHPELALACADGASTPVGVAGSGAHDNLTTHETIYGDGNGDTSSDGDGLGNMWGSWSGEGNGHGLPGTYDAGVLESEGDGGSPRDPERGVRVGGGSDDSWIALDFVEPYYTIYPAEAERFIADGRLHRSGW